MESESKSFFWGMTLHPEKRYAQTAAEPFHISKACIEPSSLKKAEGHGLTSVYLESESEEFLLCTLSAKNLNENLDLNFNKGEKICVRAEGGGIIHLSGYLMETGDDYDMDDFEEESSEEEEEEEVENDIRAKLNGVDKKKPSRLDQLLAEKKATEKTKKPEDVKAEILKAEEMKKKLELAKKAGAVADSDDSSDDSSDDDEDSNDDEAMVDLEAEEGEEEEDSDDDGEEEEEEDDSSDDSEEVPPAKAAPKGKKEDKPSNGTPAPKKKDKVETPAKKETLNTPAKPEKKKEVETPAKKDAENTPDSPEKKKKKKKKDGQSPVKEGQTPAKDGKTPAKDPEAKAVPKNVDGATPGKTPKRTLKGGLIVEDLKVGKGPEAKAGKMVSVYYVGRLKQNNKQFDACKEGEKPFKFAVGRGEVIKGWDIGVDGMKVGGKRRLICPPQLGYGSKGAAPAIPPNATLVFEVELKSVS